MCGVVWVWCGVGVGVVRCGVVWCGVRMWMCMCACVGHIISGTLFCPLNVSFS